MIHLNKPFFTTEEYERVMDVLSGGMVSQGKKVAEFEEVIRKYVGAKYAVAFNSATTALYSALRSKVDIWDCHVAIPAFTFPAAQKCVEHFGGEMSVANIDVKKKTYNMDIDHLIKEISSRSRSTYKKIDMVIPIHQYGNTIDCTSLYNAKEEYGYDIIEDAACALGTEDKYGNKTGSKGTAVFSFHGRKIITTGEGGMLVTDNKELYENVKQMRQFGKDDNNKYKSTGLNFKMSDIAATIGIAQMKKLDNIVVNRNNIASYYKIAFNESRILKDVRYVTDIPYVDINNRDRTNNFQSYVITLGYQVKRNKVIQEMKRMGIETQVGSYDYSNGECKNSAFLAEHTLALPIYPQLCMEEFNYIIESLESAICLCV